MARSRRTAPDDIGAQIENLQADIAALSQAVKLRASSQAGAARSSITEGIGDLQEQIASMLGNIQGAGGSLAEDARARTSEAFRAVEETVEKNPGTALIAALGIGFLVGVLARSGR
jgi:ElaB/YqjD/DUF883 family membrane-anchored ribosome-binding protein